MPRALRRHAGDYGSMVSTRPRLVKEIAASAIRPNMIGSINGPSRPRGPDRFTRTVEVLRIQVFRSRSGEHTRCHRCADKPFRSDSNDGNAADSLNWGV